MILTIKRLRIIHQSCFTVFLLLAACLWAETSGAGTFEFRDADRIVFLGDTLVEREQAYGYLEERLTVEFPARQVSFRNLGWSADSPAGISRAGFDFDKPATAFEILKAQVAAVHPTV